MTIAGGVSRRPVHRRQNMFLRRVVNTLRSVIPKAVEVKFLNPIPCVGLEKLPYRPSVVAIEINRLRPFVLVSLRSKGIGELAQVVVDVAKMVVDDIKYH